MAKGYKVCWWYTAGRAPTRRTLSAKQHRTAQEAAETVLMQNPNALVSVVSPRGGGRGQVFVKRAGRVAVLSPPVQPPRRCR